MDMQKELDFGYGGAYDVIVVGAGTARTDTSARQVPIEALRQEMEIIGAVVPRDASV